jgi:hypothetical protein
MENLSFLQKISYYLDLLTNKFFSTGISLGGIHIYNNLFGVAKNSITPKLIMQANSLVLSKYFTATSQNIHWHLKSAFIETVFFVPFMFMLKTYYATASVLNPLMYTVYGFAGLLINHLYGIICNDRLNMKLILRQQSLDAEKHEIESLQFDTNNKLDNITQQYVNQLVNKEINTWNLRECETPQTNTHIVSNCYLHKLIFIFDDNAVATEFLEEVQKLSTEQIYVLGENTDTAKLYQMRFINRVALKKLDGLT